jgi:hypothetical protein
VLDGLRAGFEIHVILEATRGVNRRAGDVDRAIEGMRAAGAVIEHGAEAERQWPEP